MQQAPVSSPSTALTCPRRTCRRPIRASTVSTCRRTTPTRCCLTSSPKPSRRPAALLSNDRGNRQPDRERLYYLRFLFGKAREKKSFWEEIKFPKFGGTNKRQALTKIVVVTRVRPKQLLFVVKKERI